MAAVNAASPPPPTTSPKPPATTETKKPEPPKEAPKIEKKEEKRETQDKKQEVKKDGVTSPEANAQENGSAEGTTLREQFRVFSKFGDTKSDGKQLTLSQSDKWMKQAKVIDNKTITTTDTAITFKKFKQMKISYPDYDKYLNELAKYKNQDVQKIKDKMRTCGQPGTKGTTSVLKGGAVDRLTDSQKYTGSHKQRFDQEGKGRGKVGRKDVPDESGYVAGYKNKNTYDKSH